MSFFHLPLAGLAWLGRQGTRAVAALVFIAIALPPVDRLLKPFVTEAVFLLVCVAFLRVEPAALRAHVRRPGIVVVATAWTMLAAPALVGGACLAFGLDQNSPDLFLGIMLQAVASPLLAAPALTALLGLDASLVLATLVASMALMPVTAPLFAHVFVGSALTLAPLALGVKLFAILAGAALVAAVIRRLAGSAAVARHTNEIDGFNIILLYVFVGAVMENVAAQTYANPLAMLGLTILSFAVVLALLALTALVFARTGRGRALALAFMASQRNMGLMLAATAGNLPDLVWLYFAVAQFPIYLLPQLIKPVVRRLMRTPADRGSAPAA